MVEAYRRYAATVDDIASAQELLNDPEMASLAREELVTAQALKAELEPALQLLLIPPDPNDQRNIFLEIRAGTGGAEAALFASDLHRMYLRYAESRRWQTETISESPGELGGYKEA